MAHDHNTDGSWWIFGYKYEVYPHEMVLPIRAIPSSELSVYPILALGSPLFNHYRKILE